MNRDDWLCIGIRLMGLFWLIEGLSGVPGVLEMYRLMSSVDMGSMPSFTWAAPVIELLAGVALLRFSPSIARWIRRSDAHDTGGQEGAAPLDHTERDPADRP